MSLLTRQNLLNGSYSAGMVTPDYPHWSDAQLEQSLQALWAQRANGAVWVFAYGSLIWNPLMSLEHQQRATLQGWQRSFCVRSVVGRGNPQQPGRVLALEPGGQTQGLALRLNPALALAELRLLWKREMGHGIYTPLWLDLTLDDGATVRAIAFTVTPSHPQHEPDASVATVARVAAQARGKFGPNADYVLELHAALEQHGLQDDYVSAIAQRLSARPAQS